MNQVNHFPPAHRCTGLLRAVRPWIVAVAAAITFPLAPAPAHAEPLDLHHVSADAKWVMHVDVDAARDTQMWTLFREHINDRPDLREKIDDLEAATNCNFSEDLHDITLYGDSFLPQECVVLIHAAVDRQRIENLLDTEHQAVRANYKSHEIRSWNDLNSTMFGCFVANDRIVVGRTEASLHAALDVLDSTRPSLPPGSKLISGNPAGSILYIAGTGLSDLKQRAMARSPLLEQTDMAWLSLFESNGQVEIFSQMQARSVEIAQQLKKAADGLQAMAALGGDSQSTDPRERAIAVLMRNVKVDYDQKTVSIDWRISLSDLRNALANRPQSSRPAGTAQ